MAWCSHARIRAVGHAQRAIAHPALVVIEDRVAQLFPDEPGMQLRGAWPVGRQLTGSDGTPLGMIRSDVPASRCSERISLIPHCRSSRARRCRTTAPGGRYAHARISRTRPATPSSCATWAASRTYLRRGAERLYGWSRLPVHWGTTYSLLYQDARCFTRASAGVLRNGEWTGELQQYARSKPRHQSGGPGAQRTGRGQGIRPSTQHQ